MSTVHGQRRAVRARPPTRTPRTGAGPQRSEGDASGRADDALGQADSEVQDLNWLITDFTERVPAVVHAAVVSSDGVPLAVSDGIPPDRLDQLSAITSGLISLAQGTASIFEGGAVTQTLVAMRQGVLMIVAISDGSSLAVLAVIDADLEQVMYEMTVLAEQAGGVLTPSTRPPKAVEERA